MPDRPKPPSDFKVPDGQDGGPDDYYSLAENYLLAAEILWKQEREHREKEERLPVVAPATQLLGIGFELFLKAQLLERGYEHKQLRDRHKFGHQIHRMWMMPEFDLLRPLAQEIAEKCVIVKQSPILDPKVYTIDWTIETIEMLYGSESHYALRYPKGVTNVPYIQPLLWVLAEFLAKREAISQLHSQQRSI